jgi:hypothetical protein
MKRGRTAAALVAMGAALALTGCGSGKGSSSELASNEAMTISTAPATPAKQRGLMFASDNLGRAVFADDAPAMASVPDRDR